MGIRRVGVLCRLQGSVCMGLKLTMFLLEIPVVVVLVVVMLINPIGTD